MNKEIKEVLNLLIDNVEKNIINENTKKIKEKLNEITNNEVDKNITTWYHLKLDDVEYILVGEEHKLKSSDITFYDIFKDLLNESKFEIDLYIEHLINSKFSTKNINNQDIHIYDEDDDVLGNIQDLSESRSDNNELAKIHCCDLRNNGALYLLENCDSYTNKMNERIFTKLCRCITYEYKPKRNDLQLSFYHDLLKLIVESQNSSNYFNSKQIRKLDKKYLKFYERYLKIFRKFYDIEFIKTLIEKPNIEVDEILKTCYSKINDNYTILRMLKPYKSKLRIAYLGSMHVSRIVNFFFKQCDNIQIIDHFEGTEKCLHSEIAEKISNNEKIDFLNEEYVRYI